MLSLLTVPVATTTLASVGTWSSAFFTDLLPVALMVVGIAIAGIFVAFLGRSIVRAVRGMTGGRRGRRGRR